MPIVLTSFAGRVPSVHLADAAPPWRLRARFPLSPAQFISSRETCQPERLSSVAAPPRNLPGSRGADLWKTCNDCVVTPQSVVRRNLVFAFVVRASSEPPETKRATESCRFFPLLSLRRDFYLRTTPSLSGVLSRLTRTEAREPTPNR